MNNIFSTRNKTSIKEESIINKQDAKWLKYLSQMDSLANDVEELEKENENEVYTAEIDKKIDRFILEFLLSEQINSNSSGKESLITDLNKIGIENILERCYYLYLQNITDKHQKDELEKFLTDNSQDVINVIESRIEEYEKKLEDLDVNTDNMSKKTIKELRNKYKRKLSVFNTELSSFEKKFNIESNRTRENNSELKRNENFDDLLSNIIPEVVSIFSKIQGTNDYSKFSSMKLFNNTFLNNLTNQLLKNKVLEGINSGTIEEDTDSEYLEFNNEIEKQQNELRKIINNDLNNSNLTKEEISSWKEEWKNLFKIEKSLWKQLFNKKLENNKDNLEEVKNELSILNDSINNAANNRKSTNYKEYINHLIKLDKDNKWLDNPKDEINNASDEQLKEINKNLNNDFSKWKELFAKTVSEEEKEDKANAISNTVNTLSKLNPLKALEYKYIYLYPGDFKKLNELYEKSSDDEEKYAIEEAWYDMITNQNELGLNKDMQLLDLDKDIPEYIKNDYNKYIEFVVADFNDKIRNLGGEVPTEGRYFDEAEPGDIRAKELYPHDTSKNTDEELQPEQDDTKQAEVVPPSKEEMISNYREKQLESVKTIKNIFNTNILSNDTNMELLKILNKEKPNYETILSLEEYLFNMINNNKYGLKMKEVINNKLTNVENNIKKFCNDFNEKLNGIPKDYNEFKANSIFKGTFNSIDELPTKDVDINDYALVKGTYFKYDGKNWNPLKLDNTNIKNNDVSNGINVFKNTKKKNKIATGDYNQSLISYWGNKRAYDNYHKNNQADIINGINNYIDLEKKYKNLNKDDVKKYEIYTLTDLFSIIKSCAGKICEEITDIINNQKAINNITQQK